MINYIVATVAVASAVIGVGLARWVRHQQRKQVEREVDEKIKEIIESQERIPPEILEALDAHWWELI